MGALDGIRIVELAQGIAGPYAGMLLSDQGAEVIKVEPPEGDRTRSMPAFHLWNRGKKSVVLDLVTPAGQEQARSLAANADVVIADFPPGQGETLSLDYASLARENPRLVYCYMPPYGERGPHIHRPAEDALVAAVAGVTGGQASASGRPVYVTLPVASYGAAMLAAGSVAVALYVRQCCGLGQKVTVSWLAGVLAMQTGSIVATEDGQGRLTALPRSPQGGTPVYRLYEAQDGWFFLGCGNSTFFHKLCIALERPELVADPRFENAPWGITNLEDREALLSILAPIFREKPRDYWLKLLEEADVPSAPVMTRPEFIDDPQVRYNGMRVEVNDPLLGRTVQMGVPVTLTGTPGRIKGPAPRLGEHTHQVLEISKGQGSEVKADNPPSVTLDPQPMTHALSGVRVVDLAAYIAGAYVSTVLADMGASVTKVEPLEGDPFRSIGFGFLGWNRGKRGIALNLRSEKGRQVLYEMVRQADVVVENYRVGVAQRLGVDYETLAKINPRLIYCSVTGYGDGGPYAHRPGFDPLLQARSGAMAAQGGHGQPPVFLTVAISDYAASLLAAYGIAMALYVRERTGRGQRVVTALTNSTMAVQSGSFIFYEGKPPEPEGGIDFLGPSALCRSYQCADGWIFLLVRNEGEWRALTAALDTQDLSEKYLWPEVSFQPAEGILAVDLAETLAGMSRADALAALEAAGVPCAPVLPPKELLNDPHVQANDLLAEHEHPTWGVLRQTGLLAKFSLTPGLLQGAAPTLGQHTEDVLRELGYRVQDLEALRREGVIL